MPHALEPLPPAINEGRGNAAHFPAFFLLAILFFSLFSPQRPMGLRIISTAVIGIALALGTELIQSFTPGRTASLHDLMADFFGITSALAGLWLWLNSRMTESPWKKSLHLLISFAIATILAWPYFQQLNAHFSCQKQFPVLSDFRSPQFALLWKVQNGSTATLSQLIAPPTLTVTLPEKNTFTGINYLPGPQDWSPYRQLKLTLHNPGPPFQLGIRIDDDGDCSQLNSRFNDERLLKSGENHFSFELEDIRQSPQDRELDLTTIRRLLLFTQQNSQTQKFSIVRMWLE